MKRNVKIGVVCLVRDTFDMEAAAQLYDEKKRQLRSIPEVDWELVEHTVLSVEDAEAAAAQLASALVDGVIIISGTFHLGHLALIIYKAVRAPVLLWAFNELPYNGGKIRLNAVCGVNLNASNLYKAGVDCFTCTVSDEVDREWITALKARNAICSAHVGILGYRAKGFFNLSVEDLALFRKYGILVDHYELEEAYRGGQGEYDVPALFDCSDVTRMQVSKVSALAASMEDFICRNALDAVAVRCWPEFAASYGVAPCAAMSILGAKGYTLACEGDLEGALTLLAARQLADSDPFFADLSQVDLERDFALMWHCGVAPESLWDGKSKKRLDTYFAGGKGVTADFVLKDGPVTLLRIDSARGKTRLYMERGLAVPTEQQLKGTYVKVVFERPVRRVLETVTDNGIAHHVVMVYGDHVQTLKKFAKMMDFEVIADGCVFEKTAGC